MRELLISCVMVSLTLACGCNGDKGDEGGKPVVVVSVTPLAYFAERIAGSHANVKVLVPPGANPHTFEPRPRQMADLTGAKLFFRTSMTFEDAVASKLAGATASVRIVNVNPEAGASEKPKPDDHDGDHHGHDHHGHDHHGIDPHVWMSPKAAKAISQTMCDELCAAVPSGEEDFRKNLQVLLSDLDQLDKRLAKALAPLKGSAFYVFHPAFGHFARAYGLKQHAIEVEGKAPTARQIKMMIDKARSEQVKMIFVQPQFTSAAVKTIAGQIGASVVPLDPLAKDYIANMQSIADALRSPQQ